MSRIRYPNHKVPNLLRLVETCEGKRAFKLCSVAYLSLKEEGKGHIDLSSIENRVLILLKFGTAAAHVDETGCVHNILVDEASALIADPLNYQVEQVVVGGVLRLSFRVPVPMPPLSSLPTFPPEVQVGRGVIAGKASDMKIIEGFAALRAQAKQLDHDVSASAGSKGLRRLRSSAQLCSSTEAAAVASPSTSFRCSLGAT